MVAVRINTFGGMIPAVDDRLLPENQAARTENVRLLTGAVEPMRTPATIYTPVQPDINRVYRIPISGYSRAFMSASYWLEFENPDVDVIHSPTVQDEFDRYYWAQSQDFNQTPPQYNTLQRIADGDPALLLGIPTPTSKLKVSREAGVFVFELPGLSVTVTTGEVSQYLISSYRVDSKTLAAGQLDPSVNFHAGELKLVSSLRGSINAVEVEIDSGAPRNEIGVFPKTVEMRLYTATASVRLTTDAAGKRTVGAPAAHSSADGFYVGQGEQEARAYVYTFVSLFGEEGAPSEPTEYTGWSEDPWVIAITPPGNSLTDDRVLDKIRIYRTVSGVGGTTTYFLVDEVDISATSYTDTKLNTEVSAGTVLQSTLWTPPPEDLEGMTLMPNGIIAGWRGNEVWFCEPYRPHAWPVSYTIAVEHPIIGIGVIGQTAVICTTGNPYTVSGINPATMTVSRIASYEPCISRGSIVSGQSGVLYASPNGLCVAVPGSVQVLTEKMITPDQWRDTENFLNLPNLRAANFGGAYYCWGSTKTGSFQPTAFDNDSFETIDYTGAKKGAIIDLKDGRVAFNFLTSDSAIAGVMNDHWTGEVFYITDNTVKWVDTAASPPAYGKFIWKSKIFETPFAINHAAMRVFFEDLPGVAETPGGPFISGKWNDRLIWEDAGTIDYLWYDDPYDGLRDDQKMIVRLYADGRTAFTREVTTSGELMRLPAGFKARFWQIEIESRVRLKSIEMAQSPKELMRV